MTIPRAGHSWGTEDAERRLEQRREALAPWVDENTYIVTPDETFSGRTSFTLGGGTDTPLRGHSV